MKNKTEIVIVLDRSGSMQAIKDDMEGGFKTFLDEQKTLGGDCSVSLYTFDDKFEKEYEDINLKDINSITIHPRGWTALLDGICEAIETVGKRLAELAESERSERVLFYVISDGAENKSTRFTKIQTEQKIKHQENKYNWKFTFAGCNFDMIGESAKIGISYDNAVNFSNSKKGISKGFDILSKSAAFYRSVESQNLSASTYAVTREDREEAEDKK